MKLARAKFAHCFPHCFTFYVSPPIRSMKLARSRLLAPTLVTYLSGAPKRSFFFVLLIPFVLPPSARATRFFFNFPCFSNFHLAHPAPR